MRADPQTVLQILVILRAGILHGLLSRSHVVINAAEGPRLGVELGILHRQVMFQMIPIRTPPAIHHIHGVAMWMRVVTHPRELIFETDGIEHPGVAIQATDAVPETRR